LPIAGLGCLWVGQRPFQLPHMNNALHASQKRCTKNKTQLLRFTIPFQTDKWASGELKVSPSATIYSLHSLLVDEMNRFCYGLDEYLGYVPNKCFVYPRQPHASWSQNVVYVQRRIQCVYIRQKPEGGSSANIKPCLD
jgi:hypothetical protein